MEGNGLQLLTQAVEQQAMPHALHGGGFPQYEHQKQISNHQNHHKGNHIPGTLHHQILIPDSNNERLANTPEVIVAQGGYLAHQVSPQFPPSHQTVNNAEVTPVGMTDPKRGRGSGDELQKTREHLRRERDSCDDSRRIEFAQQFQQQQQHPQLGYGGAVGYQHAGYWNAPINSGHQIYQYATTGEHHGVGTQQHSYAGAIRQGQGDLGILNAETFDAGGEAVRARREIQRRSRMSEGKETRESTWGYVTEDTSTMCAPVSSEHRVVDATSQNIYAQEQQRTPTSQNDTTPSSSIQEVLPELNKRRKRKAKAMTSPNPEEEEDEASKKARGRPRVDPKDETPAERRRTQIRLAQRAYRNRKESTISSLEDTVKQLQESSQEVNSLFLRLFDLASSHGILGQQPELASQIEKVSRRIKSADDTLPEGLEVGVPVQIKYRKPSDVEEQDLNTLSPDRNSNLVPKSQSTQRQAVILLNAPQALHSSQDNMQLIPRLNGDNASSTADGLGHDKYQSFQLELFAQTLNMQANPPLPASGAHYEVSFARRLQRRTTECALNLALEEYPHPGKWCRVFGISSQFETRTQIVSRLQKVISATRDMTLSVWSNQPFIHYGGSGTHYPNREQDISTTPKLRTEYGMGPFSHRVTKFQDKVLQDSLTLDNLAHYKDTYYDADDVQGYLVNTLGINISPSEDEAFIELDLAKLFETMNREGRPSIRDATAFKVLFPTHQSRTHNDVMENTHTYIDFSMNSSDFAVPQNNSQAMSSSGSSPNENACEQRMMSGGPNHTHTNNGTSSTTTRVTIDVGKFIGALVAACTCLGRAPGYKPADVNQALMDSLEVMPTS